MLTLLRQFAGGFPAQRSLRHGSMQNGGSPTEHHAGPDEPGPASIALWLLVNRSPRFEGFPQCSAWAILTTAEGRMRRRFAARAQWLPRW